MDFFKKSLVLGLEFLWGKKKDERDDVPSFNCIASDFHPFFHDQLKETLLGGEKSCSEEELLAATYKRMMGFRLVHEKDEIATGTMERRKMQKKSETGEAKDNRK